MRAQVFGTVGGLHALGDLTATGGSLARVAGSFVRGARACHKAAAGRLELVEGMTRLLGEGDAVGDALEQAGAAWRNASATAASACIFAEARACISVPSRHDLGMISA